MDGEFGSRGPMSRTQNSGPDGPLFVLRCPVSDTGADAVPGAAADSWSCPCSGRGNGRGTLTHELEWAITSALVWERCVMTDYAVVEHGGKQYRVSPGDVLLVERTVPDLKAGDELRFDRVMMVSQSDAVTVGKPIVEGVSVLSQVVGPSAARRSSFSRRSAARVTSGPRGIARTTTGSGSRAIEA